MNYFRYLKLYSNAGNNLLKKLCRMTSVYNVYLNSSNSSKISARACVAFFRIIRCFP